MVYISIIKDLFSSQEWLFVSLRVACIIALTFLVASTFSKISNKRVGKNQLFKSFLRNIVICIIYLAGILSAIWQVPQLSKVAQAILAGSGILALAISLSAQESLNNIISGMFIILFKPFEIGDRITLVNSNITGTIEDITLRHTVIKTFINSRIIIPNSSINKENIENSNLIDTKASSFIDIGVGYESDIDLAMQIMADVIGNHPYYIDTRTDEEKLTKPKVKVYVRELGASAVMLRASIWTQTVSNKFDACSDVRLAINKEFDRQGIEIPYNKITISNLGTEVKNG